MSYPQRNKGKKPVLICGKSRTRKVPGEVWDINKIIKRYKATGLLPKGPGSNIYLDLSEVPDLTEAANIRDTARMAFQALPLELQYECRGDFRNLEKWLVNPKNREDAINYGFIKPKTEILPVEKKSDASGVDKKPE